LPRRLGDDPLTRARKGKARAPKAAEAPASAVVAPRNSSNDVFFQRRAEEQEPTVPSRQQEVREAPETDVISEISEIPALREAAAAPPVQNDGNAAAVEEASQAPETAQEAEAPSVPEVASPEVGMPIEPEVAPVAEAATQAESVPDGRTGPSDPLPAPQAPDQRDDEPQPEKGGGFFKRLFGRFGK
jgi:hypothetical protein